MKKLSVAQGHKIRIPKHEYLRSVIPGSTYKVSPFTFRPQAFVADSERLNTHVIDEQVQTRSLTEFEENPDKPMIYVVAGSPDDDHAKYFAGHLCGVHVHHREARNSVPHILWETLYSSYKGLPTNKDPFRARPTMMVISNLTPHSTPYRLERARDLIEFYDKIPRIVVVAGEDPLTYASTRLHVPVHGLAFIDANFIRRRIEVE